MQAEGTVMRLEGVIAHVKVMREQGCGRCHEVGGCGGQGHEAKCQEFVVDNTFGAHQGQRVRIEVPEGAALSAALLMYGLPLLALLAGAGLGRLASAADGVVAAGAAIGLVCAMTGLRLTRRMDFVMRSRARITGVLGA